MNYGPTGQEDAVSQTPDIHTATRKLRNLQEGEIYDSTKVSQVQLDEEELKENTHDTIYFRTRFFANPDFLDRFDINLDGEFNQTDVNLLESIVEGTYVIPTEYKTSTNYHKRADGTITKVEVLRGDITGSATVPDNNKNDDYIINNPNDITQADVIRAQDILEALNSPSRTGGVRFYLLNKSDYDAAKIKRETGEITGYEYTELLIEKSIQNFVDNKIPSMIEPTVYTHSFTGLSANSEYVVITFDLMKEHYAFPANTYDLLTKTAS